MTKRHPTLEERISKLEKLIVEKTMGRNGEQSNAYKIWNFLMDNGPKTAEEIKAIFPPEKRATIAANLAGFPKKGVIIKQGGVYAANPDYEWDDIGKISDRVPSMADAKAAMATDLLIGDLSIDDVINMVNDEFNASPAGSEASLVLDSQDADSFDCTIEFDEYDYLLKLHGEINGDTLYITVPCTVYDDAEEEIGEVEWRGKTEFTAACTKVKALRIAVGLCGVAVINMMEQFDELD